MKHGKLLSTLLILTFLILAASTSQAGDTAVIGYVQDSLFHPLLTVTNDSLAPADAPSLDLKGSLADAFEPDGDTATIEEQEDYEDMYTDELSRYGVVHTPVEENERYYILNHPCVCTAVVDANDLTVIGLMQTLAKDSWDHLFAKPNEWQSLPEDSLEGKSLIQLQYTTDLDHDGRIEAWLIYKLMWDDWGRVVYEQNADNSGWTKLADHCMDCD